MDKRGELVNITNFEFAEIAYEHLVKNNYIVNEDTMYSMYTYVVPGKVIKAHYLYNRKEPVPFLKVTTINGKFAHFTETNKIEHVPFIHITRIAKQKYPNNPLFLDSLERGIWRCSELIGNVVDLTINHKHVTFHHSSGGRDEYNIVDEYDHHTSTLVQLKHIKYTKP